MNTIIYTACAALVCTLSVNIMGMDRKTTVRTAFLKKKVDCTPYNKELKQSTDRSWKNRRRDPGTQYTELSKSLGTSKKRREINEHINEECNNFRS